MERPLSAEQGDVHAVGPQKAYQASGARERNLTKEIRRGRWLGQVEEISC